MEKLSVVCPFLVVAAYEFFTLRNIVAFFNGTCAGLSERWIVYDFNQFWLNPFVRLLNDTFYFYDRVLVSFITRCEDSSVVAHEVRYIIRATWEIITVDVLLGGIWWLAVTVLGLRVASWWRSRRVTVG
jgi:hypothetical protein